MSRIAFKKYQGTGNDFIIIQGPLSLNSQQIQKLCDRKFGIGADGVIVLSQSETLDFDMHYYNADGSSSFCGNGSRCAVLYAKHHGWIQSSCHFNSNDGEHKARFNARGVEISMLDCHEIEAKDEHYIIDTGSPHYLRFDSDIDLIDVETEGKKIRYSEAFKAQGINVNFIQIQGEKLKIRTYERGVEAETLSCGTGVTAAALAYNHKSKGPKQGSVVVESLGGELEVKFKKNEQGFSDIYLSGPAEYVFQGEVEI